MLVAEVNRNPRCAVNSRSNTLICMRTRKPLETWQLEDAARLRALFKQRAGKSQLRFALDNDIGTTQGLVWQYLNGRLPLNLKTAIKFARGLECSIAEFSPTLARELGEAPAPGHVVSELGAAYSTAHIRSVRGKNAPDNGMILSPEQHEELSKLWRELAPLQIEGLRKDIQGAIEKLIDGARMMVRVNQQVRDMQQANRITGVVMDDDVAKHLPPAPPIDVPGYHGPDRRTHNEPVWLDRRGAEKTHPSVIQPRGRNED